MSLQIQGDDLVTFGERLEVRSEHLQRTQSPVQEDDWPASPVNLIVKLEAVDIRVMTSRVALASPGALGFPRDLGLATKWGGDRGDRQKHGGTSGKSDCSRC